MKKQFSTLMLAAMIFAANIIYAQAPSAFNYQAVLRDASGNLITTGNVEMQFTIRTGTATGTVQYQETTNVTPNQFGLVNHEIGTATVVSGTVAGVTWSSGDKFLQVEANTGGGLVDLGTQQLVSVPYAINAKTADALSGGIPSSGWTVTGNNISNSNSGNVGVGATSPIQKLDVNGRMNVANGVIQKGGAAITNITDLGLYSRTAGSWMRFVTNAADFKFYTNDSIGVSNSGSNPTMIIKANGRVGIGTATPLATLHVVGFENVSLPAYAFYARNTNGTSNVGNSPAATVSSSIHASSRVTATEFNAYSDARIKQVIGTSDNKTDLNILRKIIITDYAHIDKVTKGNKVYKKVIAQELEKVFPNAVAHITDVIPDVFKLSNIKDGVVSLENTFKAGDRVKVIGENFNEVFEVIEATSTSFRIDKSSDGEVFVYGREVDDFRVVDYEAISMLNVSATQELAKEIDALKAENELLKSANGEFKAEIEAIKAHLGFNLQGKK